MILIVTSHERHRAPSIRVARRAHHSGRQVRRRRENAPQPDRTRRWNGAPRVMALECRDEQQHMIRVIAMKRRDDHVSQLVARLIRIDPKLPQSLRHPLRAFAFPIGPLALLVGPLALLVG